MGEPFERISGRAARVVGGAAGGDDDLADLTEVLRGQGQLVKCNPPVPDAGSDRRLDGTGLLHDLLHHEMLIAALLGRLNVPGDAADFFVDILVQTVENANRIPRQLGKLAVLEVDDVSRVGDQGGDVRGEEILVEADPQDERAGFPDGVHFPGLVGADDAEGVGALEPVRGLDQSFVHVALVVELDQVDDDLGVGLALKVIPIPDELLAEGQVILDDPVVDDRKAAVVREVRVGIFLRRSPMGRPARVADPGHARHVGPVVGLRAQVRDAAGDLADRDLRSVHDRDAGRVIAAVLQFL